MTTAPAASPSHARRRTAALLLIQFVTMWAAFFILAPAINWPASLDEPPAVILPLILDQSGAVFAGYLSYLIHALALIPLAILLRDALRLDGAMGRAVVTLGVLAGFAKALGIVRWLFLMPGLAAAYTDPAATPATKDAIAVVYEAFNAYAGGVGELLGVGLFAGIWTIVISVAVLRQGWTVIGYAGLGAAVLLLSTLLSVVGIESPVMLTLSGILWQFWTLALAITIWRKA
ncbi:hypothetical protein [Aestuariivirga sp.]|jgi:hypothetical protein|uniref:hypothetical protein n=1 Tax=Aestuariivirga sp. TaxID=2650926 RepID=UPI003783DD31